MDRLAHALPHWIEHNQSHAAQFEEWSERALEAGLAEVANQLAEAAEAVNAANQSLELAHRNLVEHG